MPSTNTQSEARAIPGPDETIASGEAMVSAQSLSFEELSSHPKPAGKPVLQSASPLLGVKARLQVCVGETEVTVGELLGAKEGHVLKLDRGVAEPVDISLDGKIVARGQLVAVGDSFAVRLTELPVQLRP